MNSAVRSLVWSVLAGVAGFGCAGSAPPSAAKPLAAALTAPVQSQTSCEPARDRAAIASMAGTFEVSFAFDEVEALSPDYEVAKPYRAAAKEVVAVLEQSDRRVVLQHVLLIEKHSGAHEAMKHWRQDWTFEDRELVEFRGARTWQRRVLSDAEARCTWTQAVYEVDDGPRYESYGQFQHDGGRASWTSQPTHRPLPRREYTQRDDYDLIVGTNRHVIDERGWIHEQDNQKIVLADGRKLARERGLNEYRRRELPDTALAERYLERTNGFWAEVRAEWTDALEQHPRVLIHQEVSGKPLYEQLFPLAESASDEPRDAQRAKIRAAFTGYVEAVSSQSEKLSSLTPGS